MSSFSSDFATTTLVNDAMQVVVASDLGGKILSLRSRATGREWLWKNPHLPHRSPPADPIHFGEYDSGGWDEIFPSVDPCEALNSPWRGRRITDHGDLWCRPWILTKSSTTAKRDGLLQLTVDSIDPDYRFERTLRLPAGSGALVAEYVLQNLGSESLPYIWAAHPSFAVTPGMSIELPPGTMISAAASVGFELADPDGSFEWPCAEIVDGRTFDFSSVPGRNAGVAAKLFSHRLPQGRVRLISKECCEALQISFDEHAVPHVGMWLNYGAWSGADTEPYFNCCIEPTTSPCDGLGDAMRQEQAAILCPGKTRRWQVAVSVSSFAISS